MNKWALSLALGLLCVSTAVAQEPAATAMGTPAPMAATDATVMRLSNAFAETARRIHAFQSNKEHISNSPMRLRAELKKISMYLEPMREDVGTSLSAEQEAAAFAELQAKADLAPYAANVRTLWNQTKHTSPLTPRYIAKVLGSDVLSSLENIEYEEEETTDTHGAGIVYAALLSVAILLVVTIAYTVYAKKPKTRDCPKPVETGGLDDPASPPQSLPKIEKPEQIEPDDSDNAYHISSGSAGREFVRSTDMFVDDDVRELTMPDRLTVEEKYMLVIRSGGKETTHPLTKRFVSFGRKSSGGNSDIALDLPSSAPRLCGVLLYRQHGTGQTPYWLLAVNQVSENAGKPFFDAQGNQVRDENGAFLYHNALGGNVSSGDDVTRFGYVFRMDPGCVVALEVGDISLSIK